MKRKWVVLLCTVLITFSVVFATTILGSLSYWYSDDYRIGGWGSTPTFSTTTTTGAPSDFLTTVSTGFGAWNNASVPNSYDSNFSNASIKVYGGSYERMKQIYIYYPSNATGFTEISSIYLGDWDYSSTSKRGYEVVGATVYIATDRANTKTYKHEAGHSLGWYGHSSNSSDIMYDTSSSVTALTSRDINHLVQIY